MNMQTDAKAIGLESFIISRMPKGVKYTKKSMYQALNINSRRFDSILDDITIMTLKEAESIANYFSIDISEIYNHKK